MSDTVDTSELDDWTRVLQAAGRDALTEGEKIVSKGALNIKTAARRDAPHGPHTPAYALSIGYDIRHGPGWVESETGPDKDLPQGPLGVLFEYGTVDTPPIPHIEPAGDAEEPRYYAACEDLAASLVERFG